MLKIWINTGNRIAWDAWGKKSSFPKSGGRDCCCLCLPPYQGLGLFSALGKKKVWIPSFSWIAKTGWQGVFSGISLNSPFACIEQIWPGTKKWGDTETTATPASSTLERCCMQLLCKRLPPLTDFLVKKTLTSSIYWNRSWMGHIWIRKDEWSFFCPHPLGWVGFLQAGVVSVSGIYESLYTKNFFVLLM